MDIENLIMRCKENDQRAQTKIYELYKPNLWKYVNSRVKNKCITDEIIGRTFIRSFKCIEQYSFKGSFAGWLLIIARHCMHDYIKDLRKEKTTFLGDNVSCDLNNHVNYNEGERNIFFDDKIQIIKNSLNKREFLIFMLYLDGYNNTDISNKLGITVGTTKWYVSVIRAKLKEKFISSNLVKSN